MNVLKALTISNAVIAWFSRAAADGRIGVDELVEGVRELLRVTGFEDRIVIDTGAALRDLEPAPPPPPPLDPAPDAEPKPLRNRVGNWRRRRGQ